MTGVVSSANAGQHRGGEEGGRDAAKVLAQFHTISSFLSFEEFLYTGGTPM